MTPRHTISVLVFAGGLALAILAVIHFVWRNPAILGPLALPIGMTPVFLLFEFSIPVPDRDFVIGLALAFASRLMLRGSRIPAVSRRSVLLVGYVMVGVSAMVFMVASAYYDVGMAGPPAPSGWEAWVRPGTQLGEIGLALILVGTVMRLAFREVESP